MAAVDSLAATEAARDQLHPQPSLALSGLLWSPFFSASRPLQLRFPHSPGPVATVCEFAHGSEDGISGSQASSQIIVLL